MHKDCSVWFNYLSNKPYLMVNFHQIVITLYMGYINWKSAFELVQKAHIQIILHMPKVWSGPLLSIHTFCSIQRLLVDSEGPDQTVQTVQTGWSGPSQSTCQKAQFCTALPTIQKCAYLLYWLSCEQAMWLILGGGRSHNHEVALPSRWNCQLVHECWSQQKAGRSVKI